MEVKSETYLIKTNANLSEVRSKMNALFKEKHTFFRGKFVGSLKDDTFYGTTNYSTQISVKGKIYEKNSESFIDLRIVDSSPNYSLIFKTLLFVFFLLALVIVIANKSTNIKIYLILIAVFGFTFLILKFKTIIYKLLKPKLIGSAKIIAKEVNGFIIKN
ncbi:hypothetical protein KO506_03925 [Polaribacter vadi]|uniref:hypothetical protein n=1 Tax=Polaribacter TaxID=52959 RepID=UPI001C088C1E|nr:MULTISPECIES: hypothetical protein [Polaribacter]MBU3010536.1 hypothetical protein [Polaribacter vadi]MDO6740346.1 hypothetical protein [Polaribacter sp. 1_MG-2023]